MNGFQRRLLGLALTPVGQFVAVCLAAVIFFAPTYWLGLWPWMIPALALMAGFVAGWAAARKHWRKNGYVPKL